MEHDFAGLVENAELHRFGVKVDTAVMGMLSGVESHGLLLKGIVICSAYSAIGEVQVRPSLVSRRCNGSAFGRPQITRAD